MAKTAKSTKTGTNGTNGKTVKRGRPVVEVVADGDTPQPTPAKVRREIDQDTTSIAKRAESITVRSQPDYDAAGEFLTTVIKPMQAKISETFDPNIRRWHEGHRAAIREKKEFSDPVDEAERLVKKAMGQYVLEDRRRREEEQRKLEEAAREAAEEEAVERLMEAQEDGDEEEVEAITGELERGVETIAMPPVVHRNPKAEGVAGRTVWKCAVVDQEKVVRGFLVPDVKAIEAIVKKMGPRAGKIVGEGSIRVWEDVTIAAGRR